ncbi:transglutaminase-like cysteine peptidase [Aminobacter anthyllidis]
MAGSAAAHPSLMLTASRTSQPIGHYELCKRLPEECAIRSSDQTPLKLSKQLLQRLEKLTVSVNQAVKPMNDIDIYGKDEYWAYPDKLGDCEDYVLRKRRVLMQEGISPSNLLITVLRKPDGEGHAVLSVRTDQGDFVLDNLSDSVVPWDETGYTFLKRQANDHTGRWVTILEGAQEPLVGSVQ